MTLQDFAILKRYETDIEVLEERIERLFSKAEGMSRRMDGLPYARNDNDRLAEYMVRLEELEGRRTEKELARDELRGEVEVWLSSLPERQALVIRLRYMDELKWTEISQRSHFGLRHCYKLREAAVKKMAPNGMFLCARM